MSESHVFDPLVRRWGGRCALSASDREAILDLPYSRRSYVKDDYIVREGDRATSCNLLVKGFAFRNKLLSSGSRQIISFHIPSEFLDLDDSVLDTSDYNVQAANRVEVAVVPSSALRDLGERNSAVRLAISTDMLVDSAMFREWVVNVGRRDSRARIAHLLCELVVRMERNGQSGRGLFDFPITQEQLADASGLTAVHTNRMLQTLRRDGLIQLGNGLLKVLDWNGLRDVADFRDVYLHETV